jgi:Rod binding domain-containing protein
MPPPLSSLAMDTTDLLASVRRPEMRTRPETESDEQKIQLAKDFESVLLMRLFKQVKESIGHWGFEQDGGSDQVQGLFWHFLAQDVADKGGFGLWQDIYQTFKDMESAANARGSVDRML